MPQQSLECAVPPTNVITCPHCLNSVPYGALLCRGCKAEIEYGATSTYRKLLIGASVLIAWFIAALMMGVLPEAAFIVAPITGAAVYAGGRHYFNTPAIKEKVTFYRRYSPK